MRHVAERVWQIPLAPRDAVNAYLLGDVLVDAGLPQMGRRVVAAVEGHEVRAHTLTHAHHDHVGGSKAVLDALGVPFWAPAGDAEAAREGRHVLPPSRLRRLLDRLPGPPAVAVARELREGDEVAGFRVLDTPGHSPGHISFWREADRVLVCGDVWFGLSVTTLRPALRKPLDVVTVDPRQNEHSMRRLADLEPHTVCFGHGPVLRGAAPKLRAFVDAL